jgi:hypothetical protein
MAPWRFCRHFHLYALHQPFVQAGRHGWLSLLAAAHGLAEAVVSPEYSVDVVLVHFCMVLMIR